MRILVNATTCVVGGGIQVATNFIRRSLYDPGDDVFRYIVSPGVHLSLGNSLPGPEQLRVIETSPARIRTRHKSHELLRKIEVDFKPDVVFTVFGPAYFHFSAPHLCGFADGWVTHPSKIAVDSLGIMRRLVLSAKRRYKAWHLSPSDYYWVESSVSQSGLSSILGISPKRIQVIPNCYSPVFDTAVYRVGNSTSNATQIFTLCAPYLHKNLCIIPRVASILSKRDPSWRYRFIVTLPEQGPNVVKFWDLVKRLGVSEMIQNVGTVPLDDCPRLYAKSDIVFLPTLLETFSVTYLEAMRVGCAIVTTDLDFARDICGKAAEYFEPSMPEAAASALIQVAKDSHKREQLIDLGRQRLKSFPTPEEKYQAHLAWLREVAGRNGEAL